MTNRTSYIGTVGAVKGSTVSVQLSDVVSSRVIVIGGTTYRVGQVGSFVKIPIGYHQLYGVVSQVGADPRENNALSTEESRGWITVQLVGEAVGGAFERGLTFYPNSGDEVHLVTKEDLATIYGVLRNGFIRIGDLASADEIPVALELDKFVTRHAAILGSTGAGKSTTVTSLIRSIAAASDAALPRARILLLDIHGEYANALGDLGQVFRISPEKDEKPLYVPYWGLDTVDIVNFLTGGVADEKQHHFLDRITKYKQEINKKIKFDGIQTDQISIDTPLPYSIRRLWHELIYEETKTLEGANRDQPALVNDGDVDTLVAPTFRPHAMGATGPFLNPSAPGLKRQLVAMRSRLLDKRYAFLFDPGPWSPATDGTTPQDLDLLLQEWLGHEKAVTILDLSGVPSEVLIRVIGGVLRIVYEALFWGREKSEGGRSRPLLCVMEEAHRYLSRDSKSSAKEIVQKIVKEGRKYGVGAVVISQRPSEVDETILSQCGTFIALRLANSSDRSVVEGTMPDNLVGLLGMLPILRTGEAVVTGESARMPFRCKVTMPSASNRPSSSDPKVFEMWQLSRIPEDYNRLVSSWRAQTPRFTKIVVAKREPVPKEEE